MSGPRLPAPAVARLAAALVGALGRSLRLRVIGAPEIEPRWRAGRPLVYAVWHGRLLIVPWIYARLRRVSPIRPVAVLASRSRDGDLAAAFAACFGLTAVRGSSTRGGVPALRTLLAAMRAGHDAALVPDGPRGPAAVLRPGVVTLARLAGAEVVPLGVAARPAWRLSTWDRFLVPLPLGRAAVVFGGPVLIGVDEERLRAAKRVQAALEEATARAEDAVAT